MRDRTARQPGEERTRQYLENTWKQQKAEKKKPVSCPCVGRNSIFLSVGAHI